ncbi:hypothetical protein RCL1_003984 [Eukaryota sp. TZLM3-RCL]
MTVGQIYSELDNLSTLLVAAFGHLSQSTPPLNDQSEFSATILGGQSVEAFVETASSEIVAKCQLIDELIVKLPDPISNEDLIQLQKEYNTKVEELRSVCLEAEVLKTQLEDQLESQFSAVAGPCYKS